MAIAHQSCVFGRCGAFVGGEISPLQPPCARRDRELPPHVLGLSMSRRGSRRTAPMFGRCSTLASEAEGDSMENELDCDGGGVLPSEPPEPLETLRTRDEHLERGASNLVGISAAVTGPFRRLCRCFLSRRSCGRGADAIRASGSTRSSSRRGTPLARPGPRTSGGGLVSSSRNAAGGGAASRAACLSARCVAHRHFDSKKSLMTAMQLSNCALAVSPSPAAAAGAPCCCGPRSSALGTIGGGEDAK